MQGQKHLVKCRCILPQFKRAENPPVHKFIVFSVIDDDDKVVPKFAQCNNCGLIHKIVDICSSEIMRNREFMTSIKTIDDIKQSLPENLAKTLELNKSDLPTYEAVSFIYENKLWGSHVVMNSDSEDGLRQGKYVRILGEVLFKVESYTREEVVT